MKNFYIKIQNKGEIDVNGVHLMGVSSKREDSEKIGFFGSGNKYAIALLLRKKIPFKIFSGHKEIVIETEPVMFRGQLYDQIVIDGQKTSLTTSMGPDWETWFAIRELYCNAVDEGEEYISIEETIQKKEGTTSIFIQSNEEISDFFRNIQDYILIKKIPLKTYKTEYGKVSIYPKKENEFICFRKGIRIYPENKMNSLYQYNFSNIDINESRTYKYEHQIKEQIASFFTVCDDREILLNYFNNWKGVFEEDLYWGDTYVNEPLSTVWHELLKGKRIYPESIATKSGDFEGKMNSFILPNGLADKIAKEIKDCEVVGKSKNKDYYPYEITEEQNEKVKNSVKQLKEIGYQITSKIEVVETVMGDVVAWYDDEKDTIFLNWKYITTEKYIMNTLLEEHFHSIGMKDGQRSFVTFLIDEIIRIKSLK